MKTKWTIETALNYLSKSTASYDIVDKRIIVKKEGNGLGGLKACSAVDFLRSNGYR